MQSETTAGQNKIVLEENQDHSSFDQFCFGKIRKSGFCFTNLVVRK